MTDHALITITEKIQNALDNNQYNCGVNHRILLSKLEYYGIRGIPHDFIKSFLTNRKHYTNINGVDSNTLTSTHGIPQGSVLGPDLFMIYINDMIRIIQHSEMHHFADDTNLLYSNNSMKKINRHKNHDLKLIAHWLRVNRISLNSDKTEITIFRPKGKDITKKKLNFRLSGQQIYISKQVKYLGFMLDESLTSSPPISMLKVKPSISNGLLAKLRYYTLRKLLATIYDALFESHIRYGC